MTIAQKATLSADRPQQNHRSPTPYQFRPGRATELVGVVKRIAQRWDDTLLVELTERDEKTGRATVVKVEDENNELRPDLTYRFMGFWKDHHKYSWRFHAETFSTDAPISQAGVVAYLVDTCDHVGKVIAQKLWDRYGQEAIATLRDDPGQVVRDAILHSMEDATEAAECLRADTDMQRTKIDLMGLFKARGFGKRVINKCVALWGAKAAEIIRHDPFKMLVARVPGASFDRCDKLHKDLARPPHRLKRQCLRAWDALRKDTNGHTWFPMGKLHAMKISPRAVLLGVRVKWLVVRKWIDERGVEKEWVTERAKAQAETILATNLRRLLEWKPPMGDTGRLEWPAVEGIEGISDHQRGWLNVALTAPVCILAGTPGTGKTYCAAKVIKTIIATHGPQEVVVCAPTGKAAVRIQENFAANGVELQATTIHKLLRITPETPLDDPTIAPVAAGFVIVDEVSMCDVPLLAMLLSHLPDGTHVLFIGDPYQLPPVGHGAPLRDMIASGVIPVGELTEIRRNAGTIVEACKAIKEGKKFPTVPKYNPDTGENLRFIHTVNMDEAVDQVLKLQGKVKERGFDPMWDTQVLVALNTNGPAARVELNRQLQDRLNRDGFRNADEGGVNPFRVDDKIICTRNHTMKLVRLMRDRSFMGGPDANAQEAASYIDLQEGDYDPDNDYGEGVAKCEEYVANGEIGRVVAVGARQTIARFDAPDRLVRILHGDGAGGGTTDDASEQDDDPRGFHFSLAYAITGHKSQGSEWPCVIIVVDHAASHTVCSREWIYTAISRAKKLCVMVGERRVADAMCGRVALGRRRTFLVQRLQEANQ